MQPPSSDSAPQGLRPRRHRKNPRSRAVLAETQLGPERLMLPLFIHDRAEDQPIGALPGHARLGPSGLLREAQRAAEAGLAGICLFPALPESLKTKTAGAALDPEGLVPRTVRRLKAEFPDLPVVTDVALDPYSADGHDGLVSDTGEILNDETVEVLCRQAVLHADAGADTVAPSDMMDGRVGAIREALELAGHTHTQILAYTAKYASAYYGPFREALDSAPRAGDKKTYQMDPGNRREALRELFLDESEGADLVMVKPAGPYLDVISELRAATTLPVAAYQVSGEYAQLKAAAERGWLDERACQLEALLGIRRAGADLILTYAALEAAAWFKEG